MTTRTTHDPRCDSCGARPHPDNYTTGEIHTYRLTNCVGDWHTGDELTLCDECVAAAGGAAGALARI